MTAKTPRRASHRTVPAGTHPDVPPEVVCDLLNRPDDPVWRSAAYPAAGKPLRYACQGCRDAWSTKTGEIEQEGC